MNRILITAIALTSVAFGSFFGSTAQAQYPRSRSQVIVVNGGGYGGGYGGYGGYGAGIQCGGYSTYGSYGGYVAPYYPPSAPYGAGFSGGYQPYQQMYYQRAIYGLGF
jgi:hypothetical protein